ncbi:MAG: ATPase, T2SS/T4P/T4SS family [Lachnospiraceae bacterium]|nr:ATPase, T2SS/T4P/T4SS family [Lachnospiraceae bacterium]
MAELYLEDEVFGNLLPFIRDEQITDINYNGSALWVDHLVRGRYQVPSYRADSSFLNRFSMRIANLMNRSFNQYEPLLEAETDELRISIIHESVTNTGRSISIRKTPGVRRLNRERMLATSYCTEELDIFMANAVRAGFTLAVAGLPGAGKTEYLKAMTAYIPPARKVITVEDNLEIRYRLINPGKDCIEIKVGDTFSYSRAIKASMRQLPGWLILSEARSVEVQYLLETMSTGISCMTTIHTDDVRKIPDRFCSMMGKDVTNEVYSFLDFGILVGCYNMPEKGICRRIEQAALFDRNEGENRMIVFYQDGKMVRPRLSETMQRKFAFAGISDPFCETEDRVLCTG